MELCDRGKGQYTLNNSELKNVWMTPKLARVTHALQEDLVPGRTSYNWTKMPTSRSLQLLPIHTDNPLRPPLLMLEPLPSNACAVLATPSAVPFFQSSRSTRQSLSFLNRVKRRCTSPPVPSGHTVRQEPWKQLPPPPPLPPPWSKPHWSQTLTEAQQGLRRAG